MGYEVHITRRPEWSDKAGPGISESEWKAYVSTDHEMAITGVAEHTNPQGEIIRISHPLLTEWHGHSSRQTVWFSYFEGNISVKSPDEEILGKLQSVASALSALVQGDDGEFYGSPVPKGGIKPWWKRLF